MFKQTWRHIGIGMSAALVAGCTVHPAGEREERQAALSAGKVYERPVERRPIESLPHQPTPDDLVRYALLNNADVERSYWEWRAALEQVPIDGTQATNLALTASLGISHGRTSLGQATIAAGNDPMADIVLPNKLGAAARRALELARAAGKRFRQSQLELRAKVLTAYNDYALTAQLSRLDRQDIQFLVTTVAVTQARSRAGAADQQDVLRNENELDEARNDLASNEAQLPAERASLNALLNRSPEAPLPPPDELPTTRMELPSNYDLLLTVERKNPELAQLLDEENSRGAAVQLASQQYEPDISITSSTDLQGIAQTVAGMITVPILKYEAIHASVLQAQAQLRASEGTRRQMKNDLAAEAISDVSFIRNQDREIALLKNSILPRADQVVALTSAKYETGNGSLVEVLNDQRAIIDIKRLLITAESGREKRLVDIEALTDSPLVRECITLFGVKPGPFRATSGSLHTRHAAP